MALIGESCVALVHSSNDAHLLGITALAQLLRDCGLRSVIADGDTCRYFSTLHRPESRSRAEWWLRSNGVNWLGLSYRLDPGDGVRFCGDVIRFLRGAKLLAPGLGAGRPVARPPAAGPIEKLFFAGLPETCDAVARRFPEVTGTFPGEESLAETLHILGINPAVLPAQTTDALRYDEDRLAFGRELIARELHLQVPPPERNYPKFGTADDSVEARILAARRSGAPPVIRAHLGPYLGPGPTAAERTVRLFLDWTRRLASGGFLDVLSIGTSQLTQEAFGEEWGSRHNGGGVPINSADEYRTVWAAARPMLVRTYAGTKDVPRLARIHEEALHIAWHALSFWWFCRIDGRGPNTVRQNLEEHVETLRYIASTGTPFEPNIPHHFAFRGGDDVTYILSAYLAALTARKLGVRALILQNMLNTPRQIWGLMDLARSRAMLRLLRELEGPQFRIYLETRGGLDYFSRDPGKAKAQLAAVTALMDDIEPHNPNSPSIIHVVSYSEAYALADPEVLEESIRITLAAREAYRRLRGQGQIDTVAERPEVRHREEELVTEARTLLRGIHELVDDPASAEGLYQTFVLGFLAAPYLWEGREEFSAASGRRTALIRGAVRCVDGAGRTVSAEQRVADARRAKPVH
ncbi:MAG: cobalamin-binding protein [Alkalispirochaetaceae bacterium]